MMVLAKRQRLATFAGAIGAAALLCALLLPNAQAHNGGLDPSFGRQGLVKVPDGEYFGLAVARDGTIAVLSGYRRHRVRRYLENGHPDPRFGVGGQELLPQRPAGVPYELSDFAVDARGRVLAFGSASPPGWPSIFVYTFVQGVPVTEAMVLRLDSAGDLDTTFGGGKGVVISSFGLHTEEPYLVAAGGADLTTQALVGTVDSENRPVLLAGVADRVSPCLGHSEYSSFPRGVIRLTADGAPDPGFGVGGLAAVSRQLNTLPPLAFGLTAADQPVVVGTEGMDCPHGTLLSRLSAAGAPLSNYGSGGKSYFLRKRFGRFGVIAPSGSVILRQGFPQARRLARVSPRGELDRSFGTGGFAEIGMPRGVNRVLRPVAVDSRGRIIVLGSYSTPAQRRDQKRAFLVIERLMPSGELDRSFGRHGRLIARVPAARVLSSTQAGLDARGRLTVLAEEEIQPNSSAHATAFLMRFRLGS